MSSYMVRMCVPAILAMAACGNLMAQGAPAAELRASLDIASQPIGAALMALGEQAGLQVLFRVADLAAATKPVPRVAGSYSAAEALERLLGGTGLTYEFINARTVKIVPRANRQTGRSEPTRLRLAQSDAPPPLPREETDRQARVQEYQPTVVGLPEVLVKGSKSVNVDMRRTEDDVQPYVVFDREQIERSPAGNLESFLRQRLPMNTAQGSFAQAANSTFGNRSSVDLRGLGVNQTLILLDGRRMPGANTGSGSLGQPDINGIPIAMIERIEVLPSTASGIYGGGATGGVINIITRQDYEGSELAGTYANTLDAEAGSYRFDGSAGFSLAGDRTHIRLAASYADSETLFVGDRDFAARARELQLANNPAPFYSGNSPPFGYTTNIRSQNGANLVLKDGTPLNSPITYVPVGYAGPASDGGRALVANAGQYNLELPADVGGARQSLIKSPKVTSGMLSLHQQIGASLEAYADLSWLRNEGESSFALNIPSTVTLRANAPNNPFTTAINVRFPGAGLSPVMYSESEVMRAMAGVILRLPGEWTATADYTWSRSASESARSVIIVGDPDGSGPGQSVAAALEAGSLDVMQDINSAALDWSPYLLPSPNQRTGPAETLLKDGGLRLSGPVYTLAGGPVTLSAAVQRREEDALDSFTEVPTATAAVPTVALFPSMSQTVDSQYVETRVPLIGGSNPMRFARSLELQASVRRDEYHTRSPSPTNAMLPSRDAPRPAFVDSSNEVEATKYMLGLRYQPLSDLALRVSFGTGFLPPSIDQIVTIGPISNSPTLVDPKRGGVSATLPSLSLLAAGNPSLQPEESESWSAGLVFTPRALPELRFSLDYTQIEKSNEIRSLGSEIVVALEDQLPGRVRRDPLTPADAARGYTGGVITFIDNTYINLSTARLEAWDAQLDYAWKTDGVGEFQFYLVTTWQPKLERQATPAAPVLDSVGFSSGQLEWRGNAGFNWSLGSWDLGWNTQYLDSYKVHVAGAAPATIASAILNQGSDTIASQVYHDAFVRCRFGSDVDVLLSVQNVLDEEPPILAGTGTAGGYSTYADPWMRRLSLSVNKRF